MFLNEFCILGRMFQKVEERDKKSKKESMAYGRNLALNPNYTYGNSLGAWKSLSRDLHSLGTNQKGKQKSIGKQ